MEKKIAIWKPIEFDDEWLKVDTSKFDNLKPSWEHKRAQLTQDAKEYGKFIDRLKRQHAIETGVIERLYDLKEGITQILIKEGFVESYLQHGDTNIAPAKLMQYLNDHCEAIDIIFDLVKNEREMTKGFILELHQLITTHQESTEAINPSNQIVQIPLLRGKFKIHDNNPKREDGSIFLYCPYMQVDGEIEKMLELYRRLTIDNIHPVIRATWLHHAFVQIHPFQDGNGRMARLLASLVLIKAGIFPLNVQRTDKKLYIDGLEAADSGEYQPLIDLFCDIQIRNIEYALNERTEVKIPAFEKMLEQFVDKVGLLDAKEKLAKQQRLGENRDKIFAICNTTLNSCAHSIREKTRGLIQVTFEPSTVDNAYYYTHQIASYAGRQNYFFNNSMPKAWYRIKMVLPQQRKYQLIISVHHYGYESSAMAIGAFWEIGSADTSATKAKAIKKEMRQGISGETYTLVPHPIKPLTFSLEANLIQLQDSIELFLHDTVAVSLAQIISDM